MSESFEIPESAVGSLTGLAGLGGLGACLALVVFLDIHAVAGLAMLLVCTATPMWMLDRIRLDRAHQTAQAPLPAAEKRARRQRRFRGLLLACTPWLATLGLFDLFSPQSIVGFWQFLACLSPLVMAFLAYCVLADSSGEPGELEQLGHWVEQRKLGSPFPWGILRNQLVKAFFLPLMVAFALDWLENIHRNLEIHSALSWYYVLLSLLYLVDTIYGTVGYLSTSRYIDAQIRSSDSTLKGWAVALVCYPPIFPLLGAAGFRYPNHATWTHWLVPHGALTFLWGGAILALTFVYAWATVSFGPRFSNLTNRGIVTCGPYRYLKHPAYLSKNLSWWLMSMPFLSQNRATALRQCLVLLTINLIYWLRAKTEELHLLHDPAYRTYASWIDGHGLWAMLKRRQPRHLYGQPD